MRLAVRNCARAMRSRALARFAPAKFAAIRRDTLRLRSAGAPSWPMPVRRMTTSSSVSAISSRMARRPARRYRRLAERAQHPDGCRPASMSGSARRKAAPDARRSACGSLRCSAPKSRSGRCRRPVSARSVVAVAPCMPSFSTSAVDDRLRQIARRRPLAADGGEQSVKAVVLAVVDQFGAAAGAIGVAGAVIHQRPQAGIEVLDMSRVRLRVGRCALMKAKKPAMSRSLTPTLSGAPVKAVSVVPSSECPRHGSTKKCPPLRRDGQRVIRASSRARARGCPWSAAVCATRVCRARAPGRCRPTVPPRPMSAFARTSKVAAAERVAHASQPSTLPSRTQQRVRPRRSWRSPRHAHRHRSGIRARGAPAHTSARRNRETRLRSRGRPAPARARRASSSLSQEWPGRRCSGSSSQPRSKESRSYSVSPAAKRRARLRSRRRRAARGRAGGARDAARCAARCGAPAATRAPGRARNCADSAARHGPAWNCARWSRRRNRSSRSARPSARAGRVARDAGARDPAADDQQVENLVGKAVDGAAHDGLQVRPGADILSTGPAGLLSSAKDNNWEERHAARSARTGSTSNMRVSGGTAIPRSC